MNQNINEKYIEQVLGQSYKFYKKAQEYDSKNETEGALINYLLALNNLNNFKEYMNSLLPNNIDIMVDAIFEDMDDDKDGNINKPEFEAFLKRNSNVNGLNIDKISDIDETKFTKKISPVYSAINTVNKSELLRNKATIGFVGAPWTLLVYMINQQSPKKNLKKISLKTKR